MLRRAVLLTLFITAALAASTRPVLACSCISSGPACQSYWKTDAVFEGTVVGTRPLNPAERADPQLQFADKIVTFAVRQSWKGVDVGPLEVTTGGENGGCGFPFRQGGRYVVFAHRGPGVVRFDASICSLTQEFNGTGEVANFLASLDAPASGGRVFGTVRANAPAFDPERPRAESAVETEVRLSGIGQQKVVTSTNGKYEFNGLSPGAYRVDLLLPDVYTTYNVSRQVEIPNLRACAEENYSLSPSSGITGRLVGPGGRGVPRLTVEITAPDARAHPTYGLAKQSTTTDADGYFDMRGLPPGRYIAGVNLADLPGQYNPYARTVYPGDTSEPEVITLALGQVVDLGTWRMPPPLEVVPLAGVITWNDGSPAAGVYVSVSDRTGNPVELARGAGGTTAGGDGRFVIQVRRGRVYTFAARDRRSSLPLEAPRVEIGPGPPEVVRIVIRRAPQ